MAKLFSAHRFLSTGWTLSSLAAVVASSNSRASDADCIPSEHRSLNGICNNLEYPSQGATMSFYLRGEEGAEYGEDGKTPVTDRPNERVLSNALSTDVDPSLRDAMPHSLLTVLFGQFVNHDFESNAKVNQFVREVNGTRVFDTIPVIEDDDPFCFIPLPFPPNAQINVCAPPIGDGPSSLVANEHRPSHGEVSDGTFEVFNRATSYLDLHLVYGSDEATASTLRSFEGGRLKSEDYTGVSTVPFPPGALPYDFQNLPPSLATTQLPIETTFIEIPQHQLPTAGDSRAVENIGLLAMHILFLREHNLLAEELAVNHPDWKDEELYQEARKINIAQYQNIVMYEYAPAEFGEPFAEHLGDYTGYDGQVDATTSTVFAGAAFRYGHSSLVDYEALDECGVGFPLELLGQTGGPFTPFVQASLAGGSDIPAGYDNVIRGLIGASTAPVDTIYVDTIRDIKNLNRDQQPVGLTDLMALDLRRGRLNGIPNYDTLRQVYSDLGSVYDDDGDCPEDSSSSEESTEDPMECFIKVTARDPDDPATEEWMLAQKLMEQYGKVNKIDAIMGLLAEPHVDGTSFGETIGMIIIDQYSRSRAGDRFWFENEGLFPSPQLEEIRLVTMKALLERNFDLPYLPEDESVFISPDDFKGDLANICSMD